MSFFSPTDHILWAYEGTSSLGLWIALTMRKCLWKAMSLLWVSAIAMCPVFHNLSSSQYQGTQPGLLFSSYSSLVLHFVLANSCPAKPKLFWQGDGLVSGWRVIHRYCSLCLFHFIVGSWYLFQMGILYLFLFACLVRRLTQVLARWPLVVVGWCLAISNINGLHGNLRELVIAASRFDIVACAVTKVTQRRHVAELRLPGFSAPIVLLRGSRPDGLGLACMYALAWLSRGSPGTSATAVKSWWRRLQVAGWIFILIIYAAIFCHGRSLKNPIWPHGTQTSAASISKQQICYALYHHAAPKKDESSPELSNTVFSHSSNVNSHIMTDVIFYTRWFESPRGQMSFFNNVPWQNIAIYIINQSWALNTFLYLNTKYMLKMYLNTKYFFKCI